MNIGTTLKANAQFVLAILSEAMRRVAAVNAQYSHMCVLLFSLPQPARTLGERMSAQKLLTTIPANTPVG